MVFFVGMSINKPLYGVNYMLFTRNAAGIVLVGFYFLVNVQALIQFQIIYKNHFVYDSCD